MGFKAASSFGDLQLAPNQSNSHVTLLVEQHMNMFFFFVSSTVSCMVYQGEQAHAMQSQ